MNNDAADANDGDNEKSDLRNREEVEAVGFKAGHLNVEISFVEIKSD